MDVLFLQGGGAGVYDEDTKLAASLRRALGSFCKVHYPKMPNEDAPDYRAWRARIAEGIDALAGDVLLTGHSLGASFLLKYMVEEKPDVTGLFLLAPPYWGEADWEVAEYALPEGYASSFPPHLPLFLYGSRDDDVVPFAHTERYATELPEVTVRVFDSGGHQFGNDLAEVAQDIRTLRYRR